MVPIIEREIELYKCGPVCDGWWGVFVLQGRFVDPCVEVFGVAAIEIDRAWEIESDEIEKGTALGFEVEGGVAKCLKNVPFGKGVVVGEGGGEKCCDGFGIAVCLAELSSTRLVGRRVEPVVNVHAKEGRDVGGAKWISRIKLHDCAVAMRVDEAGIMGEGVAGCRLLVVADGGGCGEILERVAVGAWCGGGWEFVHGWQVCAKGLIEPFIGGDVVVVFKVEWKAGQVVRDVDDHILA